MGVVMWLADHTTAPVPPFSLTLLHRPVLNGGSDGARSGLLPPKPLTIPTKPHHHRISRSPSEAVQR